MISGEKAPIKTALMEILWKKKSTIFLMRAERGVKKRKNASKKEEKRMEFDTTNVKLLPFVDWPHYQNHINYLFRTDAKQKWTTRYTKGNLMIIGDITYVIGKDLAERQKTAKVARNIIKNIRADYSTLRMCCVECLGEEVYSSDESLVEDVMKAVKELAEGLKRDYMMILYAVIHMDQGDPHFHLVIYDPK